MITLALALSEGGLDTASGSRNPAVQPLRCRCRRRLWVLVGGTPGGVQSRQLVDDIGMHRPARPERGGELGLMNDEAVTQPVDERPPGVETVRLIEVRPPGCSTRRGPLGEFLEAVSELFDDVGQSIDPVAEVHDFRTESCNWVVLWIRQDALLSSYGLGRKRKPWPAGTHMRWARYQDKASIGHLDLGVPVDDEHPF